MGSERKRGSITVFLALLLTLLVGIVLAGIQSVRMAAARTQILCGVDVGLYSMFAQYDRELLRRYDLFACSSAGGELDLASLYRGFESYLKPVLQQGSLDLALQQGGLTGYRLLSDEAGEVLFRQACKAEQLREPSVSGSSVSWERLQELIEQGRQWESAWAVPLEQTGSTIRPLAEQIEISAEGIGGIPVGQLFSGRAKESGVPIPGLPTGTSGDLELFRRYLKRHFGNYTAPGEGSFRLELEYLVFGGASDRENLESALQELHWMEEGIFLEDLTEEITEEQSREIWVQSLQAVRELLQGQRKEPVSYVDYLELKLEKCGKEDLILRSMNLIEQGMRAGGHPGFRLDTSVTDAEVLVWVLAGGQKRFSAVKHYGYG